MENKDTTQYADIFAALGSEPRLEIMRLLFAAHPEGMTVGEIQTHLNIPNSTLSHHLEKLRHEGLVSARRDKQFLWYSANATTVEDLLSFLYNGCSSRERTGSPDAAYQVAELIQNESQGGFMFEGFLRSIQSILSNVFNRVGLPIGFERFTEKALVSIRIAKGEARRLGHDFIGTEQILLGLIGEGSGMAWQFLNSVGVNLENAQLEVERIIGRGKGSVLADIPLTPRARQVLEHSLEEAKQLNHNYIGTEHLLLGVIREREGVGARVLQNLTVDLDNLEQRLRRAMA